MSYRFAGRAAVLAAVIAATACGPTPTSPTPVVVPTLSPLLLPRVGGMWGGALAFSGVTGGTGVVGNAGALECVGNTLGGALGQSNDSSLQITQDGTQLTAKLTSSSTGLACTYEGSVSPNGGFVLDATSCIEEPEPLVILCQPGSPVRQMVLVGSTLTATINAPVNVTVMSGRVAQTYNLYDADLNPVGGLVTNHTFNLTRR